MMMAATIKDEKIEPTKTITFRSDTVTDEAIAVMKRESLLNDGVRLSKSAAIRKALISYVKKISSNE